MCETDRQTERCLLSSLKTGRVESYVNCVSSYSENKEDRRRGGKTTSGNGQAWSSPSSRGNWL